MAAERNPLKWPEFEQLGRDFYLALKPVMEQLEAGDEELDEIAQASLRRVEQWLGAPCAATIKLDGTNVGIDELGMVVGRNTVITPGESYQKVNVWSLLEGTSAKVAQLKCALQAAVGTETIAKLMLYGELVVNAKWDYAKSGIYKGWLCFGAVIRSETQDKQATERLSEALRAAGFTAAVRDDRVVLVPSPAFAGLLSAAGIETVYDKYAPSRDGVQWPAHDGAGRLPYFTSMRAFILSDWVRHFFLPAVGGPLGEGLVIASEADGRLFKFKHGGEELGNVPAQLTELVEKLRGLEGTPKAVVLPESLLQVLEVMLQVVLKKPPQPEKQAKQGQASKPTEDLECMAVLDSALTKFDCLEEVFVRGPDAKKAREAELIDQVSRDLVKDYGVAEKEALQRAKKVVLRVVGARFGSWKQQQQ